jgi:integrase/recombinase XerC
MEKYIEKFVRYLEIEKNYSSHTVTNYKVDLNDFGRFLAGTELEKIDYLALRKYLAVLKEKNLGNRTVGRRPCAVFSGFCPARGILKQTRS